MKVNLEDACFGGIFGDVQGKWIFGYYGKIGTSTSLVVKLWSIRSGIIVKENVYNKLIVEYDSKVAIEILKNKTVKYLLMVLL